MSKVVVITDTTTALPQDLLDKYNIWAGPQLLIWGEQTYQDRIDIQPTEFYQRVATAKELPTTSQVTPSKFHELFKTAIDQGDHVLAVLISHKLSGTMQSAIQAKEMLPGARIELVDSETTAMAMGFVVLAAARAAESGATLAECKAVAEKASKHVGILFMVDTLKYLHMGGRIGGAARFLGSALNLKPILELRDGRIEPLERVRSHRKAMDRMLDLLIERVGNKRPVRLASMHANAETEALQLLDRAKTALGSIENINTELSPAVGAHTGPGTLAIAYMSGM
jgi:DegV family protein with EDD domain